MAAVPGVIEAGLPWLLEQLGTALKDHTLDAGNDGRVTRVWAERELYDATRAVFRRLRRERVRPERLDPYLFTLSQDTSDTSRYLLPRGARQVIYLKDDSTYYRPLDGHERGRMGFLYEGFAIRMVGATINGSLQGQILLAPIRQSYGAAAAGTGSAAVVLAASPTVGRTILEPSAYVGAYIGMESGNAIGEVRRVSAYAAATRTCTVAAFASAPSPADTYSIMLGLPAVMADAVVKFAAYKITQLDEAMSSARGPSGMHKMKEAYEEAYQSAKGVLRDAMTEHYPSLRKVWDPFGEVPRTVNG